jgi:hypothetical protein
MYLDYPLIHVMTKTTELTNNMSNWIYHWLMWYTTYHMDLPLTDVSLYTTHRKSHRVNFYFSNYCSIFTLLNPCEKKSIINVWIVIYDLPYGSTTDWCVSIYDLPYRFAREEDAWYLSRKSWQERSNQLREIYKCVWTTNINNRDNQEVRIDSMRIFSTP